MRSVPSPDHAPEHAVDSSGGWDVSGLAMGRTLDAESRSWLQGLRAGGSEREATLARRLRTPHVARVLDSGQDGKSPFIVCEDADIALRLAATRPERVEKLMLINPPVFDELPAKDVTQLQRNTAKFAFRTTRGILGAAPLIEAVLKKSVSDPEKYMPTKLVARYLAPFVGKDGTNHLLALASSISAEDLEDIDLRSIHVPALVIWGEEDPFVEGRVAEKLTNALPDGRLVRMPGVGRLLPEENHERLVELLLDFMRKRAVA